MDETIDHSSDDSVADKDFVPPSPPCRITSSPMSSADSDVVGRGHQSGSENLPESNVYKGNVVIVSEAQPKKRSRKQQRNQEKWNCNKREDARNKGFEYVSSRKKLIPAKKIRSRKDCLNN